MATALTMSAVLLYLTPCYGQDADSQSQSDRATSSQVAKTALQDIAGIAAASSRPALQLEKSPAVLELYQSALDAMQDRKYERALDKLDEALRIAQGDYYELQYLMALAKFRVGRFGETRTIAEYAASLRPGAADVHYLLGRLYARQGQRERAIEHLRTATLAADRELNNPRVTAAWRLLGQMLADAGYLTAAAEAYERFDLAVWDTHPEHRNDEEIAAILTLEPRGVVETRLALLDRVGDTAAAVAAAAWAAESRPQDAYLAKLYARRLLLAERPAEAFEFCKSRVQAPSNSSALLSLALEAAHAAERLESWLSELEAQIAAGRSSEIARALARRLDNRQQHADAATLWRALVRARSDDTDAAWGLAASLRADGRLEHALTSLIEFVRANPNTADVPQERLANWTKSFEDTDRLLAVVGEFSRRPDRDFATDFVLGTAAAAARQTALAEQLFQSAIESRERFALAHVAWGRVLLSLYRWDDAKRHASEALAVSSKLAAAHYVQAGAHAGLDENEDAKEAYKTALRHRPNEVEYALALARQLRRVGDGLGSQRYFQQALTIDPTNAEAAELIVESYLAARKFEIAQAQLERAEATDLPADTLRRIRTSIRYAQAGKDEYLDELARQHEQFPTDRLTTLRLAAGELALRNRPEEAVRLLTKVRTQAPDDEQALELYARAQMRNLNYDAALEVLQTLASRYPNRRDVLHFLAATYQNDFRPADARDVYRRLLELADDDQRTQLRIRLLETHYNFLDYDGALARVDEWAADEPESDIVARARLRILLAADRTTEAFELAGKRLDDAPDDPDRRSEFLDAGRAARQYKTCERRIRKWLADRPGDLQLSDLLVGVLLADDRADEALDVLKDLKPNSLREKHLTRRNRARCYARLDRVTDAIDELNDLIADTETFFGELDADAQRQVASLRLRLRFQARREIVGMLVEDRQYDRALALSAKWLADVPKTDLPARLNVLELRSIVAQAVGNDEEYAKAGEALLELAPDSRGLNNDLGYTWVELGRNIERATRMIRKDVADEPLNAAFLDSLGWAYYKAGDFGAARKYLSRAVRLRGGQDATLYDHLADAEHRLGDADSAAEHWKKASALLAAEPDDRPNPRTTQLIAALRAKLGALERAETPAVAPTAAEQR